MCAEGAEIVELQKDLFYIGYISLAVSFVLCCTPTNKGRIVMTNFKNADS